jgi:cell division septation protein DedD
MDVAEVRRLIEGAKRKKEEIVAQKIQDEMSEINRRIKHNEAKQAAIKNDLVKLRKEQDSLSEERKQADEYKEVLEHYDKICAVLDQEKAKVASQIDEREKLAKTIEKTFDPDRKLLGELMEKPFQARGGPLPVSKKPQAYFSQETETMAQACCEKIRDFFREMKKLVSDKMPLYENDKYMQYLLLNLSAAKMRLLGKDKDNNETGREVLYRCKKALWVLCNQYGIKERYYVEGLDEKKALDDKKGDKWESIVSKASASLDWYLNGKPEPVHGMRRVNFGVVSKPSESGSLASVPTNQTPAIVAVSTSPTPAVAVPTKPTPVHSEVERPSPRPQRKTKEEAKPKEQLGPEVLSYTKGKKVVVLAGMADKNEPTREWMERFFQFKEVRWYDRNARVLLQTLRYKAIDMLVIFPKWYAGYKIYMDAARENGIKTVIMDSVNKRLISQKIAETASKN